ncbi:SusC/RagA family TonB-linked outer membrane protein [Bacteroides graminisolvens]|uniref:SusC/RagA family TonB-linked outer membrane protein n=1 Tax=Bacteroides graminisolvens TaxID=477666 RepID=UPI00040D5190|nr:TonB-dependent receptor [Bacteroides graminisolvens]
MKKQTEFLIKSLLLIWVMLTTVAVASVAYGSNGQQQQKEIKVTGRVTDQDGNPVIGATVRVEGASTGVITDMEGNYYISIMPGAKLSYSYIGYKTVVKTVSVAGNISVTLQEDTRVIDEVVVVGYGVQKKTTLSGSVSSVSGKDILKSPAMNVTNSIAGTLPGLVVVAQSGEPGADYANMYIRGKSSLNENSPLVVVDGVPNRSLERIDPSTIESITVLKDASAAIYGSQAANGVILVTTKRGKVEKLGISASYSAGWSQPTKVPELTNAAEYATLVNEISPNTYSADEIRKFADGSDPWRYPNTDWFDTVLKTWSLQQNANVTMSGGTEKLQAYVSLSTRSQDGFFKNSGSKYAQHDFRANIDGKVNDYISLSLDASMRMEQSNFLSVGSPRLFRDLMTASPILPAVWPNGLPGPPLDLQNQNNPVVQSTSQAGYNKGENYVFNINAKVNVKIPWVKGLSLTGVAAIDRGLNYTKKFNKKYDLYTWDGTTVGTDGLPTLVKGQYGSSSNLVQQLDISKEYLLNLLANYQRTFNKVHDVSVLLGVESIENTSNWFSAERRNYTVSFPDELNFGDPNSQYSNGSNPGKNRWLNYFGRVNYSYKSKYMVEFVWRYQGSSKFASETRWGFFPGVSLAYRLSEEEFWKDSKLGRLMGNLKLRASYGKTGNDLIDPYQYYSLYAKYWQDFVTGDLTNNSTYYESLAANVKVQWEEAEQMNVGFDVTLLDNRLSLTADYFNNLRSKILIPQTASVPDATGMTDILPDINLGKVRNSGFDFEMAWTDKVRDFEYRIGLNGGYAKNKIIFFDEAEGALAWQKQTGHPMNSSLYYEAIGIFHNQEEIDNYPHMDGTVPGDIKFKNVNGDDKITGEDKTRIYKSDVPRWTGGLNISARYKGFDASILFQGQAGAVRYVQALGSKDGINYFKSFYDNRWTADNPNANYPRTFNRNEEYWVSSENPNTFWLHSTDFIRLKTMELGYTIPATLVRKWGLEKVRVCVSGMNLFTYAPHMKDFDPELEYKGDGFAGQGYPIQRILTAGISINF